MRPSPATLSLGLWLLAACAAPAGTKADPVRWREHLADVLPRFGHRNWIVVADSAYPAQSAPAIATIAIAGDQLAAVHAVLDALAQHEHVRPRVVLDAELEHVADADAPGIAGYRAALAELLAGRDVRRLPHEEIIGRLDQAARTFEVLILKTDCTLPYTSVFLELDCGYWSGAAEQRLRDAMRGE